MARLASVAIGGFYAIPISVLELAVKHLQPPNEGVAIVDPCAGEGEAAFGLRKAFGNRGRLYLAELETTRAGVIQANKNWGDHLAEGDFFNVRCSGGYHKGADLLWLNPPYDTDPEVGRLEERFLLRATPMVRQGGVLSFVVPFHALKASARTLAKHYTNLQCFRFPGEEWGAYKQVILFAARGPDLPDELIDSGLVELVKAWAADPSNLPILGDASSTPFEVPGGGGFAEWRATPIDLKAMQANYDPWRTDKGPVAGIAPPPDVNDLFYRKYPVASRPRAVHLAAALSAGIFNGVRVVADDAASGLPDLLVKGVFDKEFRRIEEKTNKRGEVIAEVEVQHPKLAVTVLDLNTGLFHSVSNSGPHANGAVRSDSMSIKDLLDHYGRSLMRGMLDACPVLHNPDNDPNPLPMPELTRQLFPAQAEAVRTVIKLQRKHPDRGVIILGEIGSGKTSVALASAKALGRKRILVMCPPHLLDSWVEQVRAVVAEATVFILNSIQDVEKFYRYQGGLAIALLSREKAKLGHGWEGVSSNRCPTCGSPVPVDVDFVKRRTRCDHKTLRPENRWAEWLMSALPILLPFMPTHPARKALQNRILNLHLSKLEAAVEWNWGGEAANHLEALVEVIGEGNDDGDLRASLAWLRPELALSLATGFQSDYAEGSGKGDILAALDSAEGIPLFEGLAAKEKQAAESNGGYLSSWGLPWARGFETYRNIMKNGSAHGSNVKRVDGTLVRNGKPRRHVKALHAVLSEVLGRARFRVSKCDEPLYQATGPCRMPLASWIHKRRAACYDMLIIDEAHELSSRDSAQTAAGQKLMEAKVPTMLLTGSLLNGYAESVYMNMYGISPDFRREYGRDNVARFIDRYGYWKRIVQHKDSEGKILAFGSQSERVIRSCRKAGVAPGILPLFQLAHILPLAVTLQKEDLGLGIPPRTDEKVELEAAGDLESNYKALFNRVREEIKDTRFQPGLAGKLWGAMARMPSYLDLACVGNTDDSTFELRWPDNVPERGGDVIMTVPLLDPSVPLPKEQWILDRVAKEVAEGRNVIVLCWHTRLIKRMTGLIQDAGFKAIALDPAKVGTAKRQGWIDRKVVKAKVQVMVCNPVVIQTGLNNLVHFSTQIWAENPMCNAIVFRQACGRIDRIGQDLPSSVVFPVYENSAQRAQHRLLMHKVGVSKSVDGLDPEEALRAAGVVDSEFMGFSVGKQLYQMLMEGESKRPAFSPHRP